MFAQARLDDALVVPSSDQPRVSVVVITTRNPEILEACLRALSVGVAGGPPCETVIVLNGAQAGITEFVTERVRGARTVASRVNLGLAGAANLGRSVAQGELLVLLHDDAEPQPGWLEELVRVADAHPEAGVIGSHVLGSTDAREGAGGVVLRDGSAWQLPVDHMASNGVRTVDWCQSASLLVRACTWDAVGGAEEALFPAYGVDVDLGLAAWKAGQSVLCALESKVRHRAGASTTPSFRLFLIERNRGVLRAKWADELARREARAAEIEPVLRRAYARAASAAEELRREPPKPCAREADHGSRLVRPPVMRDDLDRERWALGRAAEVYEAFARHIEPVVADVSHLRMEIDRLHREEIGSRDREIPRLHGEIARREQDLAALRAAVGDRDREIANLSQAVHEAEHRRDRAEGTLQAIYAGGWWRLRGLLLPILSLASRRHGAGRRR